MISLFLLIAEVPPLSPVTIKEPAIEVVYKKETSVELGVAEIQGQVRLPQGFSTLSVDAAPQDSYLKERLGFRLWEANRLGY